MFAARRLLRSPRAAAVVLAAGFATLGLVGWWFWPVRYDFDFAGRLHDPDDAAALVELADAVARVEAYEEPPGGARTVGELHALLASPVWSGDDWADLVRGPAGPAGSPG